jgi:hypothetical protein
MWHCQIKYEWQQVMAAKYGFCGMLCRVIPDGLKALQSGETSESNHSIPQHHIPGTHVFSNIAVGTSNLANTHLLFLIFVFPCIIIYGFY